jgi:hypothetical protein
MVRIHFPPAGSYWLPVIGEAFAVKVRDRIRVKVAPDHSETWDCRFQCRDQRC